MSTVILADAPAIGINRRSSGDLDPVEEMRLRTWARCNYAPATEREADWHPIILDEMERIDRDG